MVNYLNLREGDLVITRSWFSKTPKNIYVIIKPYGYKLFYMAGYEGKNFVIKPIKENSLYDIIRISGYFNIEEERRKLRTLLIKKHESNTILGVVETIATFLYSIFNKIGTIEDYLTSKNYIPVKWRS